MNLWRLEWLRLVRTRRLLVIVSVYVFLGLTGPLSARYLSAIVNRLGAGGVHVEFPTPRPVDGIAQFASNASQLGLLAVVLVAASALAFDARREMAVFLRTRVPVAAIVLPAYVVNTVAAVAALTAGVAAAWYETAALLGAPDPAAMLVGLALTGLFLAFAVALTGLAAAATRSASAAAGVTIGVLLALAVAGTVPPVARWLPTSLASAMPDLMRRAHAGDYLPAAVVAVAAIGASLALAVRLDLRREL
jgi:ABC-2 type transport system permease protein